MNSLTFRILATQASKQILIAILGFSVMLMSVGCTAPSASPTLVPTDTSPAPTNTLEQAAATELATPTQLLTEGPSPTATKVLEQVTVTKIEELVGIWQGSTGEGISGNYYWEFKPDGTYSSDYQVGNTSQGIVLEKQTGSDLFDIEGKFHFDGGKLILQDTGGLDTECGARVGTYTVTLFKDGDQRVQISFKAVDDPCFPRRRSATDERWVLIWPEK